MNFSQMALEKLNAASPGLSKYVIAFKDMSSELQDSDGVEVGVFIMRNGGSLFYVPVISRGGVTFPIDSIYLADRKAFFPLTKKTLEQIQSSQNANVGMAARIPQGAVKNPDMKDLVVPPRTGKFMYASDGRMGELVAMAHPEIRKDLAAVIEKSAELYDILNVPALTEALLSNEQLTFQNMEKVARVLFDGDGLPNEAIQDILEKGYHVAGEHEHTRVVVESAGSSHFTTLQAGEPGHAYTAEGIGGLEVPIAVLPQSSLDIQGKRILILGEAGVFSFTDPGIVIHQQERPYDDFIKTLHAVEYSAGDAFALVEQGGNDFLVFFDGTGYFVLRANGGPAIMDGDTITMKGDLVNGGRVNVVVSPGMHGLMHVQQLENGTKNIYLNSSCKVYTGFSPAFGQSFERSLSSAMVRHEHRTMMVLPEFHTMTYHNGEFAIDGRLVGGRGPAAKVLVETLKLQPGDSERLLKSAQENHKVEMHMSKEAAEASQVTPIVEYGQKLSPERQISGNNRERSLGMEDRIRSAAKTKDKSVIEASIISELLNDPDMFGTVSEYLPDIGQAVDRLGRTLFLARVNSNKLSESLDPEALSNMLTNLRSAYANLGESYVKLEQIAANV
jgi:hypothetical protein